VAGFVFVPYSRRLVPSWSNRHRHQGPCRVEGKTSRLREAPWIRVASGSRPSRARRMSTSSRRRRRHYGAPALLYQKAANGEADATFKLLEFSALRSNRAGFRRASSAWTKWKGTRRQGTGFHGRLCLSTKVSRAVHADALARFLKIAAEAKEHSRSFRRGLGEHCPQIGIGDKAQLALYRQIYIDGIPRRPVEEEAADARILYKVSSRPAARTSPARQRNLMSKLTIKAVSVWRPGKN